MSETHYDREIRDPGYQEAVEKTIQDDEAKRKARAALGFSEAPKYLAVVRREIIGAVDKIVQAARSVEYNTAARTRFINHVMEDVNLPEVAKAEVKLFLTEAFTAFTNDGKADAMRESSRQAAVRIAGELDDTLAAQEDDEMETALTAATGGAPAIDENDVNAVVASIPRI
jgi:hypothetical protein